MGVWGAQKGSRLERHRPHTARGGRCGTPGLSVTATLPENARHHLVLTGEGREMAGQGAS